MKVKIIFSSGGKYNKSAQQQVAEDETLKVVKKVSAALESTGHSAEMVKITPTRINSVKKINADAVFNLVEWGGRDYPLAVKVLKNLEACNIPYTGADSKSYEWCCDKISMKRMFDALHIPTPIWTYIDLENTDREIEEKVNKMPFPIIIKPAYEHCAIGIDARSVIHKRKGAVGKIKKLLETYKQPVLVEKFIKGREFTTTVLKNHKLHTFPPTEVIFKKKRIDNLLSFATKWVKPEQAYGSKVIQDKLLSKAFVSLSRKIFIKMNCKGYVRIDFRMENHKIYVLEVNINPSILPEECYGLTVSTEAAGWNFNKLVEEITKAAVSNQLKN